MNSYGTVRAYLEILRRYAELLSIAIPPENFYTLNRIDLGILPPWEIQNKYLADYRKEVAAIIIQSAHTGSPITRRDAEKMAWNRLVEILLHFPDNPLNNDLDNNLMQTKP